MTPAVSIELESPPSRQTLQVIAEGLQAYNFAHGLTEPEEFALALKTEDGAIKGGIFAQVLLGALFIKWFWIEEAQRGGGYGRALMAAAEAEGRRRGCTIVWLDTYDFQARPENLEKMTFQPDGTANRVSRIWQLPTSYNELVERRHMLEAWTELHYGFMGRSPDHVASCISGMYMGIDVFEQADPARAGALRPHRTSLPHHLETLLRLHGRQPIRVGGGRGI